MIEFSIGDEDDEEEEEKKQDEIKQEESKVEAEDAVPAESKDTNQEGEGGS